MEIWLSWNNKAEQHQIPVLPSSFEVGVNNLNTVVNINDIGDINLIGKSGLRTINIESFFPNHDYSFVTTQKRHDPYVYVASIERWRKTGRPIRLIITDTPINIAVAIESFVYGERDGSGDVYYSLELAEYVFTNTKQLATSEYKAPAKSSSNIKDRTDTKVIAKTYTVKKGDTLTTIAKKVTGNSSNYKTIATKNNIKNPNRISVGQVLKI